MSSATTAAWRAPCKELPENVQPRRNPPPAKTEFSCKASRKGGSKDKLVYPKLKRFWYSKEELNEEYGLSLVEKLPKDLSKEDISEEDWLSVFRVQCNKNTKIFLHMGSIVGLVADEEGSNKKEKRPVLEQKTSQSSLPIAIQIPWLYQLEVQVVKATEVLSKLRHDLSSKSAECSGKRDAMLRNEGARTAATIFLTELEKDKQQLESLRVQPHSNMDQIRLLEVQIEASSRTLKLLGVDESMLHVEDEVALMKVELEILQSQVDHAKTVEEIEIDRVPLVYKNPSKYVDVEDPRRLAVLIDLQGRVIEASVSVSVGSGDVDVTLLACMQDFLQKETCAGLCVVERGGIAFNLHFQMVVHMWDTSLIAINRKVRAYLGWDVQKPAGGLVLRSALKQRNMHTFRGMVGYYLKDRDEAHFQKAEHNITADDVNDDIELHSLYDVDALKNKVCLSPANVFDRCLMFWRFKLNHPVGNRFLDIVQRMVRSGHYYPSSHWIIPSRGRGMTCSKIDALWKCMAFSSSVTERDIRQIFVAEDMQSNAQPRIDLESIMAEVDVANVCDFTNHVDEDIPDFQPRDPYLPLIIGVEATQEEDLRTDDNNCPIATLRDFLCNILIELQGDNPANQRPLRLEMNSQFDKLNSVLENVSMDDLAMQITILEIHMENLSRQVGLLKVQLNKLAALMQRFSLLISRI
ncbi:hypothetical protein L7F22_020652 [Adiantum nelumboides]|nr:hypothetical protein [Adiantum nelumboides]